jgi:hypothetical protein
MPMGGMVPGAVPDAAAPEVSPRLGPEQEEFTTGHTSCSTFSCFPYLGSCSYHWSLQF